ncbi:MAG: hypothetical protein VX715_12575 [Planctomycetota bacterium]|nr:hypothetical protein [Planctomycetota bacterium]
MTILRVGATPKYASNWNQAFGSGKKKKSSSTTKASTKKKKKSQKSNK